MTVCAQPRSPAADRPGVRHASLQQAGTGAGSGSGRVPRVRLLRAAFGTTGLVVSSGFLAWQFYASSQQRAACRNHSQTAAIDLNRPEYIPLPRGFNASHLDPKDAKLELK